MRAPTASSECGRQRVPTRGLARYRMDLRGRSSGRLGHRVQGQGSSSTSIVCHDQGRLSTSDLGGLTQGGSRRSDARGGEIATVPPAMGPLAASRTRPCSALWTDPVGADLTLKPRPCGGERVSGDLLVDVDGLGMLAEIVETREATGTMALEGALSSVLADMACEMFAPRKTQRAWWEIGTKEPLALLFL